MKYLISWICWKKSCFFQIFLKFYFKKLVADIKTWGKNIIKLDSIFVLGATFFPTKRPLFYWLCISRYIYSMPADYCNLTDFFEFPCESISVSCNFDSNTSEIQKILSNCSGQQGTFLKLRHGQPMSVLSSKT